MKDNKILWQKMKVGASVVWRPEIDRFVGFWILGPIYTCLFYGVRKQIMGEK